MPLWYGNTSMHSVGRVLDGRATGPADVDEFLQFASYLAFSDAIHVNAFEHAGIGDRTMGVCLRLADLGVEESALERRKVSHDEFLLACEQAAILCASEISITFERRAARPAMVPEMLPQELDLQNKLMEAVLGEPDADWIQAIKQGGAHPTILAVIYMMVRSDDLRLAAREVLQETPTWSPDDARRLDAYCRLFLNDILARQHDAIYAPSVDRARIIRKQRTVVMDLVSKQVDMVVAARSVESTGLPGLTRLLLDQGRGEPRAIIRVALEIRERTAELRRWMAVLATRLDVDPVREFAEVCRRVEELGRDMMEGLGIRPTSSTLSAEFSMWTASGSLSMDVSRAARGLFSGHRRGRAAVLSELAHAAAFAGAADAHFEHLVRMSQARLSTN